MPRSRSKPRPPTVIVHRVPRLLDGKADISAPLTQTAMDIAHGRPLEDSVVYALSSIPGVPSSTAAAECMLSEIPSASSESGNGGCASIKKGILKSHVSSPDMPVCRAPAMSTTKDMWERQPPTAKETYTDELSIREEAGDSIGILRSEGYMDSRANGLPPAIHRHGKLFNSTEPESTWLHQQASRRMKPEKGRQDPLCSEGRNKPIRHHRSTRPPRPSSWRQEFEGAGIRWSGGMR